MIHYVKAIRPHYPHRPEEVHGQVQTRILQQSTHQERLQQSALE